MSQPEWKLLWSTDCSALYEDTTGVYAPELAIAQTDDDTNITHVYRFSLDRCELVRVPEDNDPRIVREYLVPYGFGSRTDLPHDISKYDEWFHKDLTSVAATCDHASIREDLCSDDVNKRAHAYESIGGHHGYANLDSYPQEWTEHEFKSWPERGAKLPDWSDELKARVFTLDEKTAMSRAFDAGNYANAYETNDLESLDVPVDQMPEHERVAFVLGFFGSYSLDEIGSDRELFDECYWSAAGHHVVKVAQYTDCRGEEYLEDSDEEGT